MKKTILVLICILSAKFCFALHNRDYYLQAVDTCFWTYNEFAIEDSSLIHCIDSCVNSIFACKCLGGFNSEFYALGYIDSHNHYIFRLCHGPIGSQSSSYVGYFLAGGHKILIDNGEYPEFLFRSMNKTSSFLHIEINEEKAKFYKITYYDILEKGLHTYDPDLPCYWKIDCINGSWQVIEDGVGFIIEL